MQLTKPQVAIIPYNIQDDKDIIFEINNRFLFVRQFFLDRGYAVHTLDCINKLSSVEYILCFRLDWQVIFEIRKIQSKKIYFAFEPEVVEKYHSKKNIKKLLAYFDLIMTPFDSLIDNVRIYKCDEIKVEKFSMIKGSIPFDEKKLLCNISGYKFSKNKHELYSERLKVIHYFEEDYSNQFGFYGQGGWDKLNSHNYGGVISDKTEIYHQYKFALALENSKGIDGYITEKIIDCFLMGIVPIYAGPNNIDQYIPRKCYIDYFSFKDIASLIKYLSDISEERYEEYLASIAQYLQSEACKRWTKENFQYNLEQMDEVYLKKKILRKETVESSLRRGFLYLLSRCKQQIRCRISQEKYKKL